MSISRDVLDQQDFDFIAEPELLPPVTPGDVLREEFMLPLGLSARRLAADLGVPPNRISEIIKGERGITAETAIKLGRYFKISARFWMNLQVSHDLAIAARAAAQAA